MPLVRISLLKGRSAAELRTIADAVHEALVETFQVPPDDRFQIIEQCEPGALIYNPGYLGIQRTDGIVVVQIVASDWRDADAKQHLFKAIADRITAGADVRREDVQVILVPNQAADWSFGNGVASYLPRSDS